MAYVDKNTTKAIRDALKIAFPKCKFSVTMQHGTSVNVAIMSSGVFAQDEYTQVNQYWIDRQYRGAEAAFLNQVNEIIRTAGEWWDKSDIQSDYFDTAFYYNINIGQYNKKHKRLAI